MHMMGLDEIELAHVFLLWLVHFTPLLTKFRGNMTGNEGEDRWVITSNNGPRADTNQ